jgi:tetratricopeptide (TPR) repeat protein
LLTIADPARRSASRLAALIGLAGLVYWQNDFERAEALYREARDLARELGDAPAEADTLYSLSYLRGIPKDFPAAESLARQAIERYEAINDRVGAAKSRMWLGNLGVLQGRYREALAQIEEARPVLRQAGEVFLYLNSAIVLIGTLLHLGELERARGVITEMLTAQRERADMTAVGMALFATASLAALTNRAELAARILGAMDGVHERIGGQAPPPLVAVPDPRPVTEATLDPAVHRAATEAGRVLDNAGAIELGMEALAEPVSQP